MDRVDDGMSVHQAGSTADPLISLGKFPCFLKAFAIEGGVEVLT